MSAVQKILVVDDEENIREVLATLLSQEGYEVESANEGEAALRCLGDGKDFDMVLADIRMPGLDGLQLLRKINQSEIPVTCIMMSAYGSIDTAIQAMKEGAYDYISKPFKTDEVLLTIRKAEERIHLQRENDALRKRIHDSKQQGGLVGDSPHMKEMRLAIEKIAPHKSTVLITGESGTGKELVAQAIHQSGTRADQPFIAVNCAAIPETLLESELFGFEKGAFTGATQAKAGLFEQANQGSIFLDEIGDFPTFLQVKLLRVLQEEEVRRLGSSKEQKLDVRVIAATSKDLVQSVKDGSFREDLFYRLNIFPIVLAPLRDRREDVPALVDHFLIKFRERLGLKLKGVTRPAMRKLMSYHWPGNVRELENTLERAALMGDSLWIKPEHLPSNLQEGKSSLSLSLDEELSIKHHTRRIEEHLIRKALSITNGNRTHAAKLLDISHRALLYKLKQYGIK